MAATKAYFVQAFGGVHDRDFKDFGPEYTTFNGAGLEGGFFTLQHSFSADNGAAAIFTVAMVGKT